MNIRTATLTLGAIAVAALLASAGHAQFDQPAPRPTRVAGFAAQFGGFGGGGGEVELVGQFDRDKDGRLNRGERDAARSAVGGGRQFGGRRGGFRFSSAEGTPGRKLTPADVQPYPTTPVYDIGTMRTMFLQFQDED